MTTRRSLLTTDRVQSVSTFDFYLKVRHGCRWHLDDPRTDREPTTMDGTGTNENEKRKNRWWEAPRTTWQ